MLENKHNFIFAIDPSINNTGWSYLFSSPNGETIILLDSGVISSAIGETSILQKMRYIFQSLKYKLSLIHVDSIVIEETLVNINPFTSLKLSKGQCAAICGSFLCEKNLYIYGCKSARKTLLENGNASKKECRIFVENTLKIKITNEHIADSIMIGLLHYHRSKNNLLDLVQLPKKKKKNKSKLQSKKEIYQNVSSEEEGNNTIIDSITSLSQEEKIGGEEKPGSLPIMNIRKKTSKISTVEKKEGAKIETVKNIPL